MTASTRRHLLILPAPFYGLYIPMLEFAKKAVAYHEVTMIIMQSKVEDMKAHQLLPPEPIRWIPFRDDVSENGGGDITIASNTLLMVSTNESYKSLVKCLPTRKSPPLSSELDIHLDPVDAVFADRFLYVVFDACHERKIPAYAFSFLPTKTALNWLLVTEDSPVTPDLYMDESPEGKLARKIAIDGNRFMQSSRRFLLNCYESLDEEAQPLLKKVEQVFKPPIKFIGPMLTAEKDENSLLTEWLDNQSKASVVYFSFGSVLSSEPKQLAEIAQTLMSLKRPFIWSLHKDAKLPQDLTRSDLETLDPSAPYLVLSWLKQKEVLSHPSVAVFVSHCGYNSILEAAYYGVPVVAWPLFGDEYLNAKFVERKGFGKAFKGTDLHEGRVVPADEIQQLVEEVAGWKTAGQAVECRKAAKLLQSDIQIAVAPNGPSTREFEQLMHDVSMETLAMIT